MKLYTEEQVRKMLSLTDGVVDWDLYTHDEIIKSQEPIELPSDEEIENKGKWIFNNDGHTIFNHYNTVPSWVSGAMWMKEQLQRGNK